MNKTTSVNLGGIAFNMDEDAFARLSAYLNSLKEHFGTAAYGQEVVNDIESRLAEQFASRMHDRKKEVVSVAEVEEAIRVMGTVNDLQGEGKQRGQDEPAAAPVRRLYRNPDDMVFGGVSSGIANYFNVDPIIPRVLFLVTALAAGWGILLYIVLWIIVPEAKSSSQKLEMKGSAVNIATLEENRKNQAAAGNFTAVGYFLRELIYLIGRFFQVLIPALVTVFGLVVTAVAFTAVFAIAVAAAILAFNPDSSYVDPVIRQVFNGSDYVMVVSAGFVVLIIPALVGLILGLSLVRNRNLLSPTTAVVMGVLFLAGGAMLGLTVSRAAPQIESAVRSLDERPAMSREFQVADFDGIKANGNQKIKVSHGQQTKVIAYGTEDELEHADIQVSSGVLEVRQRENFRICLFCIRRPLTVEIITPTLAVVEAGHASQVEIRGFNSAKNMRVVSTDAARVSLEGKAENLVLELDGAARVTASGSGKSLSADLANASRLDARNWLAETVKVMAANSSSAEVFASAAIDAAASNASRIEYYGNPPVKNIDESNIGRVTGR